MIYGIGCDIVEISRIANTRAGFSSRYFTEKEQELCLRAGEIIANDSTIPCTSCRYCCEECVKKIINIK